MLKNTNYYLVCTIQRLETEKLKNLQEDLTEMVSFEEPSTVSAEFLPFIESLPIKTEREVQPERDVEREVQTDIETSELADLKQEMIDQRTSLENKIQELEMQKENLEKNIAREQQEKIEIEKKMQKENDHLHKNNSQLQSELMKILKYKKHGIVQE